MKGDLDYLLRVVAPDLKALQGFIVERLAKITYVASIRSSIELKQVKYKTALPIDLANLPATLSSARQSCRLTMLRLSTLQKIQAQSMT